MKVFVNIKKVEKFFVKVVNFNVDIKMGIFLFINIGYSIFRVVVIFKILVNFVFN